MHDDPILTALREIHLAIRENTMELRALRGDQVSDTVGAREASRILGVSERTLIRRVNAGEIRAIRHGGRTVYSKRHLSDYLRQHGA